MTKLLEEWIAKASRLPSEEQDALAQRLLAEWDVEYEQAPLLEWQEALLDERLAQMDQTPTAGVTLEEFKQSLQKRWPA